MIRDPNELTIVDLAGLIYAAISVIILIFVYFLLKRIIRKLFAVWSQESLFGRDVKTRLISLGVVARHQRINRLRLLQRRRPRAEAGCARNTENVQDRQIRAGLPAANG